MTMRSETGIPAMPEPAELIPYDPEADRRAVAERLEGSPEIDALTATIDVGDMNTILTFGANAASAISEAADGVLRTVSTDDLRESDRLMSALAEIMRQFDAGELRGRSGLLGRLFGSAKKQVDRVIGKYRTMGGEVDRIYVELRRYGDAVARSGQSLERMFDANVASYHELVKYIAAGEQGLREIDAYLAERERDYGRTRDPAITFELQTLRQARELLAGRVRDLRTAEIVAMQTIPMIRTMQYNNLSLARKIDSAFIVTLPVFKQALAQAILLKRQQLQSEAVSALDRQTEDLLRRNARNTADAAKLATRAADAPALREGALEDAWKTIVDGIGETRQLQEADAAQRRKDRERLEEIRRDYERRTREGQP